MQEYIKAGYVFILLVFVGGIFWLGVKSFELSAEFIEESFTKRDNIIKGAIDKGDSRIIQIAKLKELYTIADSIKRSGFYMARKYNSYGFSFILMFTISSVVSAILIFLIAKNGWDNNQNFYLRSSFLVFFCSTSLFGILPQVFNNKENTKNNLAKYNYYSGLQIEILNLVKDNKRYIKNNKLDSLDYYISNLVSNIKENQALFFDTDIDRVPRDLKPLPN